MSSIEKMILDIEKSYTDILGNLQIKLDLQSYDSYFQIMYEDELLELLRKTMNFQRNIEYILQSTEKLAKVYSGMKLGEIISRLLSNLTSSKKIDQVRFFSKRHSTSEYYDVSGVIPHLKFAHKSLLHRQDLNCRRNCYCAYFSFKLLRTDLIEMEEELRKINALNIYPIENKLLLKEKLMKNNFQEVTISLEEAESNIQDEHFRDCVSRCRDAVEILIATVREITTGERTAKHFSSDLEKIVKHEVYDDAIKRLAQGVYSFLSLKGSHKYDETRITIYEAETALQQTYSLLEVLITNYLEHKNTG